MAVTDWVMVCSSTLRARAVTHSAKRRYPGRVKAQAKGRSSACQAVQTSVACRMGRLLLRCRWDVTDRQVPLGGRPAQGLQEFMADGGFPGYYCIVHSSNDHIGRIRVGDLAARPEPRGESLPHRHDAIAD